jgi:GST-like protein
MIDLYYWPTPNGWKVSILLEELGLPYRVKPVDILAGDQFDPEFLAISPNNKIPAIVDPDGPNGEPFSLFESGAILLYLAEKTDRFFAETTRGKYEVVEWLMFQMGGVGPMFGQANHFNRYAPEPVPYGIERYNNEMARLMGVMDRRLESRDWFAGDYSIADMALFGWAADSAADDAVRVPYPNLDRWYRTMQARPAVQRGLALLAEIRKSADEFDEEAHAIMFGDKQFERRP